MSYDRRSFMAMLALMTLGFKAKAKDIVPSKAKSFPLPATVPQLETQKRLINDFNENPIGASASLTDLNSTYLNCDLAIAELKAAISRHDNTDENNIFVGPGARYIIFEICSRSRMNGYNHFIMPIPDYGTAARFASEAGLKVTRLPNSYEEAPKIISKIEKAITPKSVIYLSNPGLPYGVHISSADIKSMLAKYPDCLFIIDEAYIQFLEENFQNLSCKILINQYSNLIVIRTFSKIYGLAGHRIGYALTQKKNIEKFLFPYRESRMISQDSAKYARMALLDQAHLKKSRDYVSNVKNEFYQYLKTQNHNLQVIDTKCVYITFSIVIDKSNSMLLKKEILDKIWEKTRYDYWTTKAGTRAEAYISITTLEKMKSDFELVRQILEGKYVV